MKPWFLISILLSLYCLPARASSICSYQTYQWNTLTRRAENYHEVRKPYSELTPDEIDADSGCSVCEQDQRWLRVSGVEPVRVCRHFVERYQRILNHAVSRGFRIDKLVGYRVGKTRGEADARGLRTRFSNHSFGIAIDVNQDSNGLYGNCFSFGPQCKLLRGGAWRPGADTASIAADSPLLQSMKAAGILWGGEIAGRQKDFMHFSPSGY